MHTNEASHTIQLPDINATNILASSLASSLKNGMIIFLNGQLGAGKTTLVRAMLNALGYTGVTKSPTYTLVESYNVNKMLIHHFDLYRLADPVELEFIGIRDYFTPSTICIFEWPEKGHGYLPMADLEITLTLEHHQRVANIQAKTDLGRKVLTDMMSNR